MGQPENVQYWLARAFPVTRYADAAVEIENAYGDTTLGASRTAALGRFPRLLKGPANGVLRRTTCPRRRGARVVVANPWAERQG